jgi:predicted MFS family arabinose efflux permease
MAIMTDDAPPDQRGVALGLRMSANQVAQASAPMAMGAMVTAFGTVIAFAMSGVLMWAILAVALWVHFIDRRAKQSVIAAP